MKKTLIAAGLALMASSGAYALDPVANPVPDAVIYAGGGSAVSQISIWLAEKLMTNVHIITSDASCTNESTTHRIFYGNLRTAAGSLPAGAKVALLYRFSGGSFPNGGIAQGKGTTLAYPNIAAGFPAAVTTGCTGGVLSTASSNTKPAYRIPFGTTVNAVPDWGVPDEEVQLLNVPVNLPAGQTLMTSAQVGNLTQAGVFVTVFGVVASENVAVASTANGNCPKTNITKAEMRGVLTGEITDWSQLEGDNGCSIAAGPIHLLDRPKGSGSKAAGNEYFLENPTSPSVGQLPANFTGDTGTTCGASNSIVSVGSNSGILAPLNANGDVSQTCRMIAVLSAEFPPAKNSPGNYQFLKIGGVDPGLNKPTGQNLTYDNVINGHYDFAYTSPFTHRTAQVGALAQHWVGDGTPYSVLIDRVKTLLQDPLMPAGAGAGNLLSPSGLLLDPAVAPGLDRCVMRTTHFGNSRAPMTLGYDFTNPLPAPAPSGCSDLN